MIVYEIAIKCFYSVVIVFVLFYHFLCLPKLNGCAMWFFFLLSSECTNGRCLQGCRFVQEHTPEENCYVYIGSVSQNGVFSLCIFSILQSKNGRFFFILLFSFWCEQKHCGKYCLCRKKKGWKFVALHAMHYRLKYWSIVMFTVCMRSTPSPNPLRSINLIDVWENCVRVIVAIFVGFGRKVGINENYHFQWHSASNYCKFSHLKTWTKR